MEEWLEMAVLLCRPSTYTPGCVYVVEEKSLSSRDIPCYLNKNAIFMALFVWVIVAYNKNISDQNLNTINEIKFYKKQTQGLLTSFFLSF